MDSKAADSLITMVGKVISNAGGEVAWYAKRELGVRSPSDGAGLNENDSDAPMAMGRSSWSHS